MAKPKAFIAKKIPEEAEENLGVKYIDLELFLKECNFIVLMVPLTKDTYHLIDYK